MNHITVMLTVLMGLTFVEFLLAGYPAARRQLFNVSFAFTFVWVSIKYYLGPDIATYVPYYEDIPSPHDILDGKYTGYLEIGFAMFCSLCKSFGMSFWLMTFTISVLYFIPLYMMMKTVCDYRTFALLILAALDYNLMLYELRQSLAVSAVMTSFLLFRNKHLLLGTAVALLSVFFHKSAIFILAAALMIAVLRKTPVDKRAYILLFITLVAFFVIPLGDIIKTVAEQLPLPDSVKNSIIHHIAVGEIKQLIFPIYLIAIACIAYYSDFGGKHRQWHWCIWCCMALIVVMFQYWFLLNRIRSYILPFILPYIFNICLSSPRNAMLRQSSCAIFLLYSIILTIGIGKPTKSNVNGISTVFERIDKSERTLRDRQLKEADIYWRYVYSDFINKKQ